MNGQIFSVLTFLLLAAATFCMVIQENPIVFIDNLAKMWQNRHHDLNTRIKQDLNDQKKSSIVQLLDDVQESLALEHKEHLMVVLHVVAIVMALVMFIVSLFLPNTFFIPVFAFTGWLLPYIVLKIRGVSVRTNLISALQLALSQVTTSYMRTYDIVLSVQENLEYMSEPVKGSFKKFLVSVNTVNPSIVSALRALSMEYDVTPFNDWCTCLIQCQRDKMMSASLNSNVDRLSQIKEINYQYRRKIMQPISTYVSMSLLMVLVPFLLKFIIEDLYISIVDTTIGQLLHALSVFVIVFNLSSVANIAKPLEFRR